MAAAASLHRRPGLALVAASAALPGLLQGRAFGGLAVRAVQARRARLRGALRGVVLHSVAAAALLVLTLAAALVGALRSSIEGTVAGGRQGSARLDLRRAARCGLAGAHRVGVSARRGDRRPSSDRAALAGALRRPGGRAAQRQRGPRAGSRSRRSRGSLPHRGAARAPAPTGRGRRRDPRWTRGTRDVGAGRRGDPRRVPARSPGSAPRVAARFRRRPRWCSGREAPRGPIGPRSRRSPPAFRSGRAEALRLARGRTGASQPRRPGARRGRAILGAQGGGPGDPVHVGSGRLRSRGSSAS